MQRAAGLASRERSVGRAGLVQRAVGTQANNSVQPVVDLCDAVKVRLYDLDRRHVPVLDCLRD